MGYWIRRSWRTAADDNDNNGTGTDADAEALHGTVTVDAAGWRTLATPALAALLDAVHTFAALTNRLLSATLVAEPDASTRVELHAHHREASLDDYYVNAMLADLPLGSIVQYAHRFQFLFHSITQVRRYSPRSPLSYLMRQLCRPALRRAPGADQSQPYLSRSCTSTGPPTSASRSARLPSFAPPTPHPRMCSRCCSRSTPAYPFSPSTLALCVTRARRQRPRRGPG